MSPILFSQKNLFQIAMMCFAFVLGCLAVWLLLPQIYRPDSMELPVSPQSAISAKATRQDAALAATLGIVRGDLWAQSAFTFADLYWAAGDTDPVRSSEAARMTIEKALFYAPHRSDVWLMLAGLTSKLHWPGLSPLAALKMSYYTSPTDSRLTPWRLYIAAQSDALEQPEVEALVRREISNILARKPDLKAAITAAYQQASRPGKRIIEAIVLDSDPAFFAEMREGKR